MKRKYFTYILLVVVSLFMFDSRVEAGTLSGDKIGLESTCKKLELEKNWLSSTSGYEVNCIYGKYDEDIKSCVVVQLSFNTNGVTDGKPIVFKTNVDSFGTIDGYRYSSDSISALKSYTKCPSVYFNKYYGVGNIGYIFSESKREPESFGLLEQFRYDDPLKMKLYNSKISKSSGENSKEEIGSDDAKFEQIKCAELLGDDLLGYLQLLVEILKVVVPILLIVFGILDFAKAIFSFDEGEMKKAQTKFIKRLIIGVAFFLIPTFLGIVLDIAHKIWPIVDNTLCGIDF